MKRGNARLQHMVHLVRPNTANIWCSDQPKPEWKVTKNPLEATCMFCWNKADAFLREHRKQRDLELKKRCIPRRQKEGDEG